MIRRARSAAFGAALIAAPAFAQQPAPQTDDDHYTRYELLTPGSASFRISYEVTATTAGATRYLNPIRRGSVASNEAVYDRMTGEKLPIATVGARVAAEHGVRSADSAAQYLMITLPRPVPKDGEVRLLIDKTYRDSASYWQEGDAIVFSRSLGIKRNAVVLPRGYEVISCNYPSQIRSEADGRLVLSFINIGSADVPYTIRARRVK